MFKDYFPYQMLSFGLKYFKKMVITKNIPFLEDY